MHNAHCTCCSRLVAQLASRREAFRAKRTEKIGRGELVRKHDGVPTVTDIAKVDVEHLHLLAARLLHLFNGGSVPEHANKMAISRH